MRFPAGEGHVKVVNENDGKGELTEVARIYGCDANDLILLGMWADAAQQRGSRTVAQIPYLPGARQDRGMPFGAWVYAGIINGFKIDHVTAFDVHSPVMESLIRNLGTCVSAPLIRKFIVGRRDREEAQRYVGIIAPDKGAVERAHYAAAITGLPLYKAEKHRDSATGKLSGFSCEPLPDTGKLLVVDDICDGGGTFMGLAEATGLPKERLDLYVSHGVFSGDAPKLHDHFGTIWTTDSFKARVTGTRWYVRANVIPLAPYLNLAI